MHERQLRERQERLRRRLASRYASHRSAGGVDGAGGADSGGGGSAFQGWAGNTPPYGVSQGAWELSPLAYEMQAIEANQRDLGIMLATSLLERSRRTGHHRDFSGVYSSPPPPTALESSMARMADTLLVISASLDGEDEHGSNGETPAARCEEFQGRGEFLSLRFLGEGHRIDYEGMLEEVRECRLARTIGTALEDLLSFSGGSLGVRGYYRMRFGQTQGLNLDLGEPNNMFDFDEVVSKCIMLVLRGGSLVARCEHRQTGFPGCRVTRGGGPCRCCLVADGLLYHGSPALDKSRGEEEGIDKASMRFVERVVALVSTLVLLSPVHPTFVEAVDADPHLRYHGFLSAAMRRAVRLMRMHVYPELVADYPKAIVDTATARCCYWTNKMMVEGGGEALLPLECLEGLPRLLNIPSSWDYETEYERPPGDIQLAMNMLVKMLDHNILMGFGYPYRPLEERCYPVRYYGAHGADFCGGLVRMEEMKCSGLGYCRYRSEGPGMAWTVDEEDVDWGHSVPFTSQFRYMNRRVLARRLGRKTNTAEDYSDWEVGDSRLEYEGECEARMGGVWDSLGASESADVDCLENLA